MITASDLRDRVVVEEKTETEDGYGGKVGTWHEYCTVWVKIERQTSFSAAAERVRAGAVDSQPVARVHLRASATSKGITTDMRIKHGDIYFNVATPPQDIEGRNRILSIMVTQGAPT